MNRKTILHIGHPKTGTTTLQKTLVSSRLVLEKGGILHPNTGPHHNHKIVIPYLFDSKRGKGEETKSILKNSANIWKNLVDDIQTSESYTVVLSSEGFFRPRGKKSMESLKTKLYEISTDVKIVAYLREPASFMLSRAQQKVKRSPRFEFTAEDYYKSSIEAYIASDIGPVNIRVFDRRLLDKADIVEDFFNHNMPNFDTSKLIRRKDSNVTLSAEAMSLMQDIRRKIRTFPRGNAKKIIEAADQKLEGFGRPALHEHVAQAIRSRATDLDWLSDRFDIRFPDIDTHAMPRNEAIRIYENLDRVEDLCVVDPERKKNLWSAAKRSAFSLSTIFGVYT